MLESQSNDGLWSAVSEVKACVDDVDSHINGVDDSVELWEVIFVSKSALVSANTHRADLKVFVVNELLEVHWVVLVHELFALFLPQTTTKNLRAFTLQLLKNLFSMVRVELFRQLYCVGKCVPQT